MIVNVDASQTVNQKRFMKHRLKKFLLAAVLAMPLLFTQGCAEETEAAWWLPDPWAPLEWIWVPADMVPDNGGGTGTGG
jgi:hypothetical protein